MHLYVARWAASLSADVDPGIKFELYRVFFAGSFPELSSLLYKSHEVFRAVVFDPLLTHLVDGVRGMVKQDRDGEAVDRSVPGLSRQYALGARGVPVWRQLRHCAATVSLGSTATGRMRNTAMSHWLHDCEAEQGWCMLFLHICTL